jgi:hypothetical protein
VSEIATSEWTKLLQFLSHTGGRDRVQSHLLWCDVYDLARWQRIHPETVNPDQQETADGNAA